MLLLLTSLSVMSFGYDNSLHTYTDGDDKKSKDSAANNSKGFKSLFGDKQDYDAANPGFFRLNPQAVSFVENYIRLESEEYGKMKEWGKTYIDLYDRILTENGIPVELKYLSIIESHLRRGLVSGAGAVGPWQLMPDEAKRYHLKTGRGLKDERTDFTKSTYAACKLINELHNEFGDWLLVIAAYNGGVGRVKQAIKKAGSRDFWALQAYLPEQTRNHVKKYIATHYIFEGGGGWTTLTAAETAIQRENVAVLLGQKQLADTVLEKTGVISISGKYNAGVIAKVLLMDLVEFKKLNPGFDKKLSQGQAYDLRLPNEKLTEFQEKRQEILQQSIQVLLAPPATTSTPVVKA
ncbi:membrane-bound lytic murein transglycosylase D precursor [Filimonas lacunae]|nr:membrane-bound lytic murein transglycosylase D precursor [Filimonas lacunae]